MKKQSSGKTLSRIVYGIILLGLAVSLWYLIRPKPKKVEKATVQRGPFYETFLIDGKVRSKNKITIVAFASGDIEQINLKAGDEVQKGQVITQLHWDIIKKIKSPLEGIIVKVHRQTAGPVSRGESLVDIIDPRDLEVVAEPLTTDALRINLDTPVEVLADEGTKKYSAKVKTVSRAGFVKTSALGVEEERTEVRMDFINAPIGLLQRLGDNFHVELAMVLSHEENVLTIPVGALFKDNDKWAVYLIKNGKANLKYIDISKKSDREALVSGGLSEGEQVILFPDDKISNGIAIE